MGYYLIISVIVVIADQLLKWWTVNNIALGTTVFENPVLSLTYLQNTGAAWNILEGKRWFFYIISIIAIAVILYFMHQLSKSSKIAMIALALALGGTIGNFIDRVRLGYVVDMLQIEFFRFPVFNIADMGLTFGVLLLLIYVFMEDRKV